MQRWRPILGAVLMLLAITCAAAAVVGIRTHRAAERRSDAALTAVADLAHAAHGGTTLLEAAFHDATFEANARRLDALLARLLAQPSRAVAQLQTVRVSRQLGEVGQLLDGIPPGVRTVEPGRSVDAADGIGIDVVATVVVAFMSSEEPGRGHRLRIDATVEPLGDADPRDLLIPRWRMQRMQVQRQNLFNFEDPHVLQDGACTIVTEGSVLADGQHALRWSQQHLGVLRRRYPRVAGDRRIVVFVAPTVEQRDAGMGGFGDAESAGLYTGEGEVGLATRTAGYAMTSDELDSILQHELTHAVTGALRGAPQAFVEGVAQYEQDRMIVADGTGFVLEYELSEALDAGSVDLRALYTEPRAFRLEYPGRRVDYLAGAAAVHVLEEAWGHERVVAFYRRLEAREPTEQALQSSFHIGVDDLIALVRTWARANPSWRG